MLSLSFKDGSHAVMTAAAQLLDQGLLVLGPVADAKPVTAESLSFDPLFSSYKQALKMLVRADGILKKVEAIIAFCKYHYDGIFILTAKTTKSLILAASARGYFINQHQGVQVYGRMLWKHAVECGIAARRIAATVAYEDPEQAFISGILQDIGKVAILMLHPEKYKQIQKLKNTEKLTDLQAENQILQTDHTHIGQLLMAKWHMPQEVQACIEFHHRPFETPDHRQLSSIVAYGNFLSHAHGEHPLATADEEDPAIKALTEQLGLSDKDCQILAETVQEDFESTELMAE